MAVLIQCDAPCIKPPLGQYISIHAGFLHTRAQIILKALNRWTEGSHNAVQCYSNVRRAFGFGQMSVNQNLSFKIGFMERIDSQKIQLINVSRIVNYSATLPSGDRTYCPLNYTTDVLYVVCEMCKTVYINLFRN